MEKNVSESSRISKANCKELLVQRMFIAIASTIVVQFLLISCTIFIVNINIVHPLKWIQDTWNIITCFRMWTYFFIFSSIIFLQGLACTKDYLNPIVYSPSRFSKLCNFFTPHNLLVCLLYMLLGSSLVWLHVSLENGKFSFLSKRCEKLQGNCLVEEDYFLLLGGFWTGFYFFMKSNYLKLSNLQFPICPQSKFSQIHRNYNMMLPSAMIIAVWPVIYYSGLYCLMGKYCRNIFASFVMLSVEETPYTKISSLLSPFAIIHLWLYTILLELTLKSMHLLFQAYLTEWISFEIEQKRIFCTDMTIVTLSDALAMDNIPILRQLGYLDLVTIAQRDQNRRSIIFSLSQPGGHPYNWNCVVEKCVSLIKNFNEELNVACFSQKEKLVPITSNDKMIDAHFNEQSHIFRMRNLVTPSLITPVDNKTSKHKPCESFIVQYINNLKQSLINYLLSKPLVSYTFGEQVDTKVRHVMTDVQTVIWASEAISSFVVASLTEDQYGIVQKDLPVIMEALLNIKLCLDRLQKKNVSLRKPMSEDKTLKQALNSLRSAVRRSIYRIVYNFRNYTDDIDFTPSTTEQLQSFFLCRD